MEKMNKIRDWHSNNLARTDEKPENLPTSGSLARFLTGLEGCAELASILAEDPTIDVVDAVMRWDPTADAEQAQSFAYQLANSVYLQREIRDSIKLQKVKKRKVSDIEVNETTQAFLLSVLEDSHEKTKDRLKAAELLSKITGKVKENHTHNNNNLTQTNINISVSEFVKTIRKDVLGVE